MNYIIYGDNRVSRDFMYIFDKVHIKNIVNTVPSSLDVDEKIIVCDFNHTEKVTQLLSKGYVYKRDFFLESDFFEELDKYHIPEDRKVAVWGTGNMAHRLMRSPGFISPEFFIDSNKKEDELFGIPVYSPDEITEWNDLFIIVAVVNDSEIIPVLQKHGKRNISDFYRWCQIEQMPSRLLRETIYDKHCYDLDCSTMLNHIEILRHGDTRFCCTTFMPEGQMNIKRLTRDDVWKSNTHKILCLSTENRTYTFCNKHMCPLFVDAQCSKCDVDRQYAQMTETPEVIAVGYDKTCNLYCETCRPEIQVVRGREKEEVNKITDILLSQYLSYCKFLILAGDGEVFLSQAYKSIYSSENVNPAYIRLLSNGTLITPRTWSEFRNKNKSKIMLTVSIDAATPETYVKVRRGGNFEQLSKNMKFLSEIRRSGDLSYLRMNFVVQRDNYMEMIPFVKWGEDLGVDEVFFTKILNWGMYSDEEFKNVSMMEADGITPKPELKAVLDSPEIKNSKIADLGTIQYNHKKDYVGAVENYYMWELEKRGGKLFEDLSEM